MSGRLDGRVAIITGAGTSGPGWGTGRAMAVVFAKHGAKLVLLDTNAQAVQETEALVLKEGAEAISVVGDVSRTADVQRLIETGVREFGGLDILINNVGIAGGVGLLSETEEAWQRAFDVNAKGVFLTAKHAVPYMLKRGRGRIVNIASVAGIRVVSLPPGYGYSGSKAAIIQMTRAMALEFASQHITCNCIVPGMLDTANVRTAYARLGLVAATIEAQMKRRDQLSPIGKQGTAFDVAEAALFLASDEASFINGAEILIDGGQVQMTPM